MKPTEIRIGNYVLDPLGEKIVSICKSDFADNTYLRRIKPVPLTEEILNKAGFVKDGVCYKLRVLSFGSLSFFICENDGTYCELVQDREFILGHIECDYLHQLQNIIHSLTGEELKITEL